MRVSIPHGVSCVNCTRWHAAPQFLYRHAPERSAQRDDLARAARRLCRSSGPRSSRPSFCRAPSHRSRSLPASPRCRPRSRRSARSRSATRALRPSSRRTPVLLAGIGAGFAVAATCPPPPRALARTAVAPAGPACGRRCDARRPGRVRGARPLQPPGRGYATEPARRERGDRGPVYRAPVRLLRGQGALPCGRRPVARLLGRTAARGRSGRMPRTGCPDVVLAWCHDPASLTSAVFTLAAAGVTRATIVVLGPSESGPLDAACAVLDRALRENGGPEVAFGSVRVGRPPPTRAARRTRPRRHSSHRALGRRSRPDGLGAAACLGASVLGCAARRELLRPACTRASRRGRASRTSTCAWRGLSGRRPMSPRRFVTWPRSAADGSWSPPRRSRSPPSRPCSTSAMPSRSRGCLKACMW